MIAASSELAVATLAWHGSPTPYVVWDDDEREYAAAREIRVSRAATALCPRPRPDGRARQLDPMSFDPRTGVLRTCDSAGFVVEFQIGEVTP